MTNPVAVQAEAHSKKFFHAVLIPRCPSCWERDETITPNPDQLMHCPKCGEEAPAPELVVYEERPL